MSMVFLARGNFTIGCSTTDKQGNVVESTPSHFDIDPEGGCVAVGLIDDETGQPKPGADLFGDYQAAEYLSKALELLGPGRPINLPDIKAMVLQQKGTPDEDFICDRCMELPGLYDCQFCIVNEWKEDTDA